MSDGLNIRTARWLLALVLLLILYGSLFPFELRSVEWHGLGDLVARLRAGTSTRGDRFANVLLYVPLGAALVWAQPAARGTFARLAFAVLAGGGLSLAIETTQIFLATRVAAFQDVATNLAGTLLGASAALLVNAAAGRLASSESFRLTREPVGAALLALWLASFLPPWLPSLDPRRWPTAWGKLADAGWPAWDAVALQALGWLVAAAALRALTRPQYVWPLLALLAGAAMLVRGTALAWFASTAEPLGAVAALLAWPLLARLPERSLHGALFAALLGLLFWRGLAPFQFVAHAGPFRIVPFADLISRGSTGFNLPLLFGKAFWYGGLVWLLVQRGVGALGSGVFVATALAVLECLQAWTPPGAHVAGTTDPVIALAAGLVLTLFAGATGGNPSAAGARKVSSSRAR